MTRALTRSLAFALGGILAISAGCSPGAGDRPENSYGRMSPEELSAEGIAFELNVAYAANENPRQRLDLYLPASPKSDPLPVLVFFHGGGWKAGDKTNGVRRLLSYLQTGRYALVSANYRLSNEALWPAQLHDAKAAVRWVHANAERYGLDPDRIAVWGHSAGAHLALMVGLTADVPELEGEVGPHREVGSEVSAVANFFGMTDMPALVGHPGTLDHTSPQSAVFRLIGGPPDENEAIARAASPVTHITPNDPPVLTIHGTKDPTFAYDQAERLHRALNEAGVRNWLIPVLNAGHGALPPEAGDRAATFFDRILLGEKVTVSTEPLIATHPDDSPD